jgi:hypothetical protein
MRDFAIKRKRKESAKRKLIDCLSFRIDEVNPEGGAGDTVSLSQLHFCGLPEVCSCPPVLTSSVLNTPHFFGCRSCKVCCGDTESLNNARESASYII